MKPGNFVQRLTALLGVLLLLATACASEVGDIDRTDPDKLRKTDLKGVWYYATTVFEAPVPSPVTFDGEMAYFPGPVKVLFDIQEDYLVVYPTSELYVAGSEAQWHKKSIRNYWEDDKSGEFIEMYVGQPVAAFKVEKHFDVIRKYNAQTGEQSNIIVEDTADHKWFEREYIRVDWSANKIEDLMFMGGAGGGSVDYYVQEYEEDNPDAFEMSESSINFVTKIFLEPSSPDSCSIYMVAPADCVGVVAKVRHSFLKADPNNDYVPLFYDQIEWMEEFGFFLTERNGYSEDHGLQYSEKQSFIQRWNIWDRSRTAEPILVDEAQVVCKDDVDCEGLHDGKVHCWLEDGWFSDGHCVTWDAIPVHERGVRPIRYWISANWPDEVKSSCYETADEWNRPFTDTVAWTTMYSEAGLMDVRYCETHADCTPETVQFDTEFSDRRPRYCNKATEADDKVCQLGFSGSVGQDYNYCAGDGTCKAPQVCGTINPCSKGQLCLNDFCHVCPEGETCDAESGAGYQKLDEQISDRGAFSLYYLDELNEDDKKMKRFRRGIDNGFDFVAGKTAQIAFAHLNRDVGKVTLKVDLQKLMPTDGQEMQEDLKESDIKLKCADADGNDLTFEFQGTDDFRTPGCLIEFPVGTVPQPDGADAKEYSYPVMVNVTAVDVKSKKAVGKFNFVHLESQTYHTFALVGDAGQSYLIHGSQPQEEVGYGGIRLVHGVPGGEALDFLSGGAQVADKVTFGEFTRYGHLSLSDTRVVVLPAGTPAEVTCFHHKNVGMCTGPRYELSADDVARVDEVKASLPPMFVVCDNVYTGDLCDKKDWYRDAREAAAKGEAQAKMPLDDCRYWHEDEDGEWYNPCADIEGAQNLKKHGDLRYSLFYWVSEDQASSPLGYGPNAGDPETGEVYYGIANIYGAPMIGYGNYANDLLKLARGDLDPAEVMTGKYIQQYLEGVTNTTAYESLHAPLPDPKRQERIKQIAPPVERFWLTSQEETDLMAKWHEEEFLRDLLIPERFWKKVQASQPPSMTADQLSARFNTIKGSWVEDLMITEEVKHITTGGSLMGETFTSGDFEKLSPTYWASSRFVEKDRERLSRLAEHNYYAQDWVEPNVYHTALAVQEHCSDPANREEFGWTEDECAIWRITKLMLDGVLEHEVGHTIGLRHNFSASKDIFNYQDEYYSIREEDYRTCNLEGASACIFSDYCRVFCDTDADCPAPGQSCQTVTVEGDSVKACVNAHFEVEGTCWGTRDHYVDCTSDGDCLDLDGAARCDKRPEEQWGRCEVPAVPDADGICPGGSTNVKGTCFSEDACNMTEGEAMGRCTLDPGQTCPDPSTLGGDYDRCSLVYQDYSEVTTGPIKSFYPRSEIRQSEADKGRSEYMYSTLMDYGGTVNFDIQGIGKWDEAAIRFGYGELSESYVDTNRLMKEMDAVDKWGKFGPKYSWVSGLFMDTSAYNDIYLFSPWLFLEDFIGRQENLERIPVPFRKSRLELTMVDSDDRGLYDASYFPPSYENSTDMWRGNLETYVWDLGADLGEIIDHSWSKLHEYYIFDAFKRGRWGAYRGANPLSYYSRILSRWFPPLEDAGRYHAMFWNIWRYDLDFRRQMYSAPHFMGRWEDYAEDSLRKLTRLIFSPAPGSYRLTDQGTAQERFVNIGFDMGEAGSEVNIPVGDGKFPYTTFYGDAGYYYYDHAQFIGSFWEKLAAARTLTYAMGYFMGDYMGEQVTVGVGASIGFPTVFYNELSNMVAGYMIGEKSWYAPYVENDQYYFFDPLRPHEAAGMTPMDTGIETLAMKAYLGLYGFAFIPSGFDTGFLDSMRLCLKGNGECFTTAEDTDFDYAGLTVETIDYLDPWTKKTYVARTTNYDEERIDGAYELLLKANDLKAQWEAIDPDVSEEAALEKEALGKKLSDVRETLDLLYTFNELFGLLQY